MSKRYKQNQIPDLNPASTHTALPAASLSSADGNFFNSTVQAKNMGLSSPCFSYSTSNPSGNPDSSAFRPCPELVHFSLFLFQFQVSISIISHLHLLKLPSNCSPCFSPDSCRLFSTQQLQCSSLKLKSDHVILLFKALQWLPIPLGVKTKHS